ncbi:MAG: sterol desaturase family protein [Chlorobiales bacterium]|jgi:sterol desaturase/sphingolipid hydroxylase (fatty acid hydroxylase superfamily)|nr:sterol desaturase family protein [Chlorobiales bacterium]
MSRIQILSLITLVSWAVLLWMLEALMPFFLRSRSRSKHAGLNLSIAGLNLLILFPSSLLTATVLSQTTAVWRGVKGLALPMWAQTVLILVLIDLWMYTWHRMNHRLRFLWRFHAVHHSDPDIDVTTAWRFHFVEILFGEILRLAVLVLIGAGIEELLLYILFMTPVIVFHHSNVRIPAGLDRALRILIPTPHMHRVHHSTVRSEHDSNYGSMLSVWDRMFRSFQLSDNVRSVVQGLDGESSHAQQRLFRLLQRPFRKTAYPM